MKDRWKYVIFREIDLKMSWIKRNWKEKKIWEKSSSIYFIVEVRSVPHSQLKHSNLKAQEINVQVIPILWKSLSTETPSEEIAVQAITLFAQFVTFLVIQRCWCVRLHIKLSIRMCGAFDHDERWNCDTLIVKMKLEVITWKRRKSKNK
jgi:hypothetical protein